LRERIPSHGPRRWIKRLVSTRPMGHRSPSIPFPRGLAR
jgi:hypothetical protein